jgi:protein subunit release factor A
MMKIDKKIFKVDITKGTGAGGQHKNKVETCVTVTHIPSGKKETCQETRSKTKNLETAYTRLFKRLQQDEMKRQHLENNAEKLKMIENAGTIRTYNYQRNEVKDHRSGKTADLKKFLDGNLDLL